MYDLQRKWGQSLLAVRGLKIDQINGWKFTEFATHSKAHFASLQGIFIQSNVVDSIKKWVAKKSDSRWEWEWEEFRLKSVFVGTLNWNGCGRVRSLCTSSETTPRKRVQFATNTGTRYIMSRGLIFESSFPHLNLNFNQDIDWVCGQPDGSNAKWCNVAQVSQHSNFWISPRLPLLALCVN